MAAGLFCALPLMAGTTTVKRQTQSGSQALGSLSTVGVVYVNGMPAPTDATVFPGDTLKTDDLGSAVFAMSGKGSFKIASNTELAFPLDPRYSAELRTGTVVMNSFNGATDISLRVGYYVVAPVIQSQQSASQIARHPDGSFTISCLEGSVGLIPLEGATGRVLQSGESVNILPSGELEVAKAPGAPPPTPTEQASAKQPTPDTTAPPPVLRKNNKNTYILLGVAGAAAVGIAAGVAGAGHGSPSVSPSVP